MTAPTPFETVVPFIARFTLLDVPVTDATGVIFIYRLSDNMYWNGATWQGVRISVAMTEISEVQQTGDWRYNFDTAVGNSSDEYVIEMVDSAVAKSDNIIERISLWVGSYIDPLIADIKRILGLDHDNIVVDATAISLNGKMTEGDVYIYDSASNATLDGRMPATGLIFEYHIDAPLTVQGAFDTFTQIRVL